MVTHPLAASSMHATSYLIVVKILWVCNLFRTLCTHFLCYNEWLIKYKSKHVFSTFYRFHQIQYPFVEELDLIMTNSTSTRK